MEESHSDYLGMRYEINQVLFSKKSKYQTVEIIETKGHGRMLLNDGFVMVSERDEFIYHDMMAHVPLFVHPGKEKNVLVLGGGDGGTAREVLRHPEVKQCTMVEIDLIVIEACRAHFSQTSKAFSHPRLNLEIDDAIKFIENTKEQFDVILIDSTDPIGPAVPLFSEGFYQKVFDQLKDDGIVVAQGGSPFYETHIQKNLMTILHKIFPISLIYNFTNLTYPGGLWSFGLGSKSLHPIGDFDRKRVQQSQFSFQYYNEDIHTAAFQLPTFMKKSLEGLLKDGPQ